MKQLREYFSRPVICSFVCRNSREKLVINKEFEKTLASADLLSFDNIWDCPEGELIKRKNNRSVNRLELSYHHPENTSSTNSEKSVRRFFLKRHSEPLNLKKKLRLLIEPDSLAAEGLTEFETYCDFRKNRLATAVPVAGGVKRQGKILHSFLITMDFSPLSSLEDIILQQPESLESPVNRKKRRAVLTAIADYARRMHESGINQKDFNATHILVQDIDSPEPVIALFDLQHVDRKPTSRFRWPVKALAELDVSLPASLFPEQERTFLFRRYKKKNRLDFLDKIQYKWIVKKAGRIRKHTLKNNLAPKSTWLDHEPDRHHGR